MAFQELVSFEPATGALMWRGAVGDVDAEVDAARTGWADWASRPLTVRIETVRRFANIVRSKAAEFADLIARETGKPLWEAKTEVEAVIAKVDLAVLAQNERTANRRMEGAMGVRNAVRHKPHGVLGVVTPYSFPAHIPNAQILPALLAGNAVVFKPSEKAPASGALLVQCYHEAGVPEGVLRLLIGGPAQGKALATHDGVDGLLFTGSPANGIALNRSFADRPDRILALEMGGNNPVVLWNPTDIHAAAVVIAQSAFATAGQRCTSARRLIVEDGKEGPVLAELGKLVDRMIVGDPLSDPQPFMGPVIDNEAADRLQDKFLDLMMKGGKPFRRLDRPRDDRPFLTPAIIDVTEVADRPDTELFGPILQLIRVKSFEDALIEANNTRYGLCAALIGGAPALYDRFWANIRAGVVNWNATTNATSSGAPFGGVGFSGNGRPAGFYAADYCAYPVASSETEQARAAIGIGLRDPVAER